MSVLLASVKKEKTSNYAFTNSRVLKCPYRWWSGIVVARSTKLTYIDLLRTGMGDHVQVQFPVPDIISLCNQPPKSTQPGHPFMGRCREYQSKGGDVLRLGRKGRYGLCVVKLCDLITHGLYLSAL